MPSQTWTMPKSKSPTITAPFDGYITSVKVKGGDEVFKGSVALTIADPNQFEADILVTENDIASVKLDGEATVSLDALSDLTFPAKITWIAPTATVSSGVVNYKVTVTLTSLKTYRQHSPTAQSSFCRWHASGTYHPVPRLRLVLHLRHNFTPPAGLHP